MNTPKVSVILATHNNAAHIGDCLDSILNERFQDVELIAVDMMSTDGTKEMLVEEERQDERITLLIDSFGSIGHAKNLAMSHARGEYLLIVEPDGYLCDGALERLCLGLDGNRDTEVYIAEVEYIGDDSFERTYDDRARIISGANKKDDRTRDVENRFMRRFIFDSIAIYRKSFLHDKGIRHYEVPGYGRQDAAFRFLAAYKGMVSILATTMYVQSLDIPASPITDVRSAFDVCNEFRFLKEGLKGEPALWHKARLNFWQSYYDQNMLLYERLSDDIRPALSKRMQGDIKEAIYHREYSAEHFDISVRNEMELLLRSADDFDRYQGNKISEREKRRDAELKRENRLSEIFISREETEIDRLSREAAIKKRETLRANRLDRRWLTDEMSRDMAPLRMLLGLSTDEMGEILGVSGSTYKSMEAGKKEVSWDQYMTLLFLFRYNDRTSSVADTLGLYPDPLKTRMKKGTIHQYV